jgi:hypothetical protein
MTLKFTGAFTYEFIMVGRGGDGGNVNASINQGAGGGGAGSIVTGTFKSNANDTLLITTYAPSYDPDAYSMSMDLNSNTSSDYASMAVTPGKNGVQPDEWVEPDSTGDSYTPYSTYGNGGDGGPNIVFLNSSGSTN